MQERENLKTHIEMLFAGAEPNLAVYQLQEELLANSLERFDDLLAKGIPPQEAFHRVVESIGNVDELIMALPAANPVSPAFEEERRARSAMVNTVAVGLYILAAVMLIVALLIGPFFGALFTYTALALAVAVCIAPTCMLVYNAYRWPRYRKKQPTVVEDFKAWKSDSKRRKANIAAVSTLIGSLTLIVYFLVSFKTGAWHITWLVFLVGPCVEAMVLLKMNLNKS